MLIPSTWVFTRSFASVNQSLANARRKKQKELRSAEGVSPGHSSFLRFLGVEEINFDTICPTKDLLRRSVEKIFS